MAGPSVLHSAQRTQSRGWRVIVSIAAALAACSTHQEPQAIHATADSLALLSPVLAGYRDTLRVQLSVSCSIARHTLQDTVPGDADLKDKILRGLHDSQERRCAVWRAADSLLRPVFAMALASRSIPAPAFSLLVTEDGGDRFAIGPFSTAAACEQVGARLRALDLATSGCRSAY